MRGQTRALCPATTYLSWLSREPKRCPLALENLPLRRLTPLEVVWRPGDPPVHYRPRPISCTARRLRFERLEEREQQDIINFLQSSSGRRKPRTRQTRSCASHSLAATDRRFRTAFVAGTESIACDRRT